VPGILAGIGRLGQQLRTPEMADGVAVAVTGSSPAISRALVARARIGVADGTITVSYRLWSRPDVKVGGVYRGGPVIIEIDEIWSRSRRSRTGILRRRESKRLRHFVDGRHTPDRSTMTPCSTAWSSTS
jgi:hypothetical protein